jgi:hypothetical protein
MLELRMKRVIDTSEVLGTLERPEGPAELCASANAAFDEAAGRLVVNLDSFLRTSDLRSREKRFKAGWLPKAESITEQIGPEEARDVARDIFHRWVRKVRAAAPSLHDPAI